MTDGTRIASEIARRGVRDAKMYQWWIFYAATMETINVRNWQVGAQMFGCAISLTFAKDV